MVSKSHAKRGQGDGGEGGGQGASTHASSLTIRLRSMMRWAVHSWKWITTGQSGRKQSRSPVLGPDVMVSRTGQVGQQACWARSQVSREVKAEARMPGLNSEMWVLRGRLSLALPVVGKRQLIHYLSLVETSIKTGWFWVLVTKHQTPKSEKWGKGSRDWYGAHNVIYMYNIIQCSQAQESILIKA